MIKYIFNITASALVKFGRVIGFTYNEINVLVYYFIIPFTWILMLDLIFDFHYLKVSYAIFCLGFFAAWRNFKKYSDWMFDKSVDFLNYFNKFGSNYYASSVWICISIPIFIYGLPIYFIFKSN